MRARFIASAYLTLAVLAPAPAYTGESAGVLDLVSTQQAIAKGQRSSEDLVAQSLAEIKRNAHLNAFITVATERALNAAREKDKAIADGAPLGPLHGVPLAIKDNIHVAGLPNTAGTPMLKNFVPHEDAPAVTRLKVAGAVIVGKTNLHELAFGITSINAAFGAVGNGVAPNYIAGGSSGGTAAAIASGMVPAGLGTDTGGSSRIPAALNGIVGFRPSVGRYPAQGVTLISTTRDTIGPMARTMAGITLLDKVLSGDDRSLPAVSIAGLRLGLPRPYFYENLEPEVASAVAHLEKHLAAAGAELIEVAVPDIGDLNGQTGFPIVLYETQQLLPAYLGQHLPAVSLQNLAASIASPDVHAIITDLVQNGVAESAYQAALDVHRPKLQAAYATCFNENRIAALLFPTTPITAKRIDEISDTVAWNGQRAPVFATYIRNTDPGSNAGLPGLSLPLPRPNGALPVGIELDGPINSDRRLLAIGDAIEKLMHRKPKEFAAQNAGNAEQHVSRREGDDHDASQT